MAITMNECIKNVSKNYCVPSSKEIGKQNKWDDTDELIHEGLSDFRHEKNNSDNVFE
jgi:hypothetical protein